MEQKLSYLSSERDLIKMGFTYSRWGFREYDVPLVVARSMDFVIVSYSPPIIPSCIEVKS